MGVRVAIGRRILRPTGQDELLQRIATVYMDQEEYRVYAPAKAEGDALEWLDHLHVHQPGRDGYGGEEEVLPHVRVIVLTYVKEELEKQPATPVLPEPAEAGRNTAPRPIQLLCVRFHEVAKQIRVRHANRSTLDVKDEYDVQDLMHALLRIFIDDVRPEQWTPDYAGGASRMDFLVPDMKTAIEAKKTRDGLGAKEIGEQLIIDIAKYQKHPDCKRLVCFVYDPDGRVANARGLEKDLSGRHGELEVQVLVVPR